LRGWPVMGIEYVFLTPPTTELQEFVREGVTEPADECISGLGPKGCAISVDNRWMASTTGSMLAGM